MRIAVIGGGPGGLYFAALNRQLHPEHEITVWERNAADDTFGFGVVFSDETLGGIEHADEQVYGQMQREFARWDDIDVHFRDEVLTSGGHGFAAMSRRRLLFKHILPNSLDALIVKWGADVGSTVLVITSLSFIGAGPQPPSAEWGAMVSEGAGYITTAWWMAFFPGIAIAIVAVAFALLADIIQERLAAGEVR